MMSDQERRKPQNQFLNQSQIGKGSRRHLCRLFVAEMGLINLGRKLNIPSFLFWTT